MNNILFHFVLSTFLFNFACSKDLDAISPSSNCQSKIKCSDCIQTFKCKWCKDPNFSHKRCFSDSNSNINATCKDFEDPASSKKADESTNSAINPAKVSIKLRVGEKINISMEYTDEKNRPLDLYILMDLSCTMKIHKDKVAALAESLAKGLSQNLTSDLKMGFGSFIDKPLVPFVSPKPEYCNNKDATPAYLYKNHLKMTSNVTDFISTVNQASLLPNVDDPEGGLDALMQAISCTNGIGWRTAEQKTRRLIVISTDGPFHIAGDGKLGGVVLPNDGHCHLKDNFYDKATVLDYPTVSQLRDQIERYNIYVFFAVTKAQVGIYGKLARVLGPLSSVQSIDDNASSSIVEVIQNEYEKVVNQVELKKATSQDELEVTYFTKCPGSLVYEKKAGCGNITRGAKVEFEIQVELKACPKERYFWNKTIMIEPYQSAGNNYSMKLQLEMLCGCGCQLSDNGANGTSNDCNGHGYLKCGICACDPDWGGQFCNCTVKGGQSIDQEKCLDKSGKLCGSQGTCICGECQCNEGFRGSLCNCTDNDCFYLPNEDKGVCNRKAEPRQGKCVCGGTCECSNGFSGSRCECPDDDKDCHDPYSQTVCGGESSGQCKCGRCLCKDGFHGEFCGLQFSKQQGTCNVDLMSKSGSCVKCLTLTNVKATDDEARLGNCKENCDGFEVNTVDENTILNFKETECKGSVEDEGLCEILFLVGDRNVTSNKTSLKVERKARIESCPQLPPTFSIILLVVGIILLVGIPLLCIWKVVTYVHDKKEYQQFEKESKNVNFPTDHNPLYKASKSEYQNPVYHVDEN